MPWSFSRTPFLIAGPCVIEPGDVLLRVAEVLAALDVACSWEARHLLRQDQGVSQAAAGRVMARLILSLLDGPR